MENLPLGNQVKGQCPLNFMPGSYPPITLVLQALMSIGQDTDVEVGVGSLSITPNQPLSCYGSHPQTLTCEMSSWQDDSSLPVTSILR